MNNLSFSLGLNSTLNKGGGVPANAFRDDLNDNSILLDDLGDGSPLIDDLAA